VRILARDVSLMRGQPHDTSILNVLPMTIQAIDETAPGKAVVTGRTDGGQTLLAELTRKSVEALNLATGQQVHAQIKAVAMME